MTGPEHLAAAEGYLNQAVGQSSIGLHDGAALNLQAAIAHSLIALAIEAGVPHQVEVGGGYTDGQSADRPNP